MTADRVVDDAWPSDVAELAGALDVLELVPYDDPAAAAEPAIELGRLATEWGADDLALRARLVHADVIGRAGNTAGAGTIVLQVQSWAIDHGHAHLRARSERLLSAFFQRLGDTAASLEHAVRGVEMLSPDALPRLRADHEMALGLALARTQSFDAARDRIRTVLRIAESTGDVRLRIAVLNNMSFIEYWAGDAEASMAAARRMQRLASRHGVALEPSFVDTLARAQMLAGDFGAAERTLSPLLETDGLDFPESDDLPEVLLTLAECQRMRGDTGRASASLCQAADLCSERDLQEVMARVMQEQAAVYAAEGRFADAYLKHVEFFEANEALSTAERVARTRTLHTVFETEEAQRSSRRFREMSLRDPLTGLYNRRYVEDRLPALLARGREDATSLAVAIADLDHFKRVNDTLSHDTGDEVLRRIALMLQSAVLETGGFVARLGGEEFLVVLPGLDDAAAVAACEALRRAVREHPWQPVVGDIPVTVSLGVVSTYAGVATASDLLATADQRLYVSKNGGRDRVTGG